MATAQSLAAKDTSVKAKPEGLIPGLVSGLTSWFGRIALFLIVVFWTIPTAGLFISSLRSENAIKTSPWWEVVSGKTVDVPTKKVSVPVEFTVGSIIAADDGTSVDLSSKFGPVTVRLAKDANVLVKQGDRIKTGDPVTADRKAPKAQQAVIQNYTVSKIIPNKDGSNRVELIGESKDKAIVNLGGISSIKVKVGDQLKSGDPIAVDPRFTTANYKEVLDKNAVSGSLGAFFWNSVQITLVGTLIPILIASFAAYGFAWMDFKGRNTLFLATVALLVVPLQMSFIPLLRLINNGWHLGSFAVIPPLGFMQNNVISVWFAHACFGMPISIYLLRNFIGSLPRELMEAARVDGATHMRTFITIVLPLSVPALASLAIFQFLWVWNDLAVATVFAPGDNVKPLTAHLVSLAGSKGEEWQRLTAAAFVTMVLPLTVFLALQRFFVRGLVSGAVKG